MNDLFNELTRIAYAGYVPQEKIEAMINSQRPTIDEMVADILDRNDGPVTEFVAIYRAMDLAKQSYTTAGDVANALCEALTIIRDSGTIPSGEFNY
jgi:predicted transcriptional regulator